MRVVVTGASGFVGGYTVARLVADGHSVLGLSRAAVRDARRATGAQYRDGIDVSERATLSPDIFAGADAVVHLVGIIVERPPKQTFERIHVQGTRNVADAVRDAGVPKLIYLSAIGSDASAAAEYSRTKAAAEEIVRSSGAAYTILRPSIILGRGGEFVDQMRDLVRHGGLPLRVPFPVIPVPGNGNNQFQPIYIDDLTHCLSRSVTDDSLSGKTVEVAGSTRVTFNVLLDAFARAENVHKAKLHAPIGILALLAPFVELLPKPPFSGDQLKNLKTDNIADIGPMRAHFGIEPLSFEQAMARIYAK